MSREKSVILGVLGAGLVALLAFFALRSTEVQVPQDAATVELTGTGKVTVSGVSGNGKVRIFRVDGDQVSQLGRAGTLDVSGSTTLKFKGRVKFEIGDGDLKLVVNGKTVVEVPARQEVVIGDDQKIELFGILPRRFHVSNCQWLVANGLGQVTAENCEKVDAFGKSRVLAKGSKVVTANTFATVIAEDCEQVTANDRTYVEAKRCKAVLARGTARVAASNCDLLEATDESRVKHDGCQKVEIRDAAKKVLILGF